MHSNSYIIRFVLILTTVVALLLSVIYFALKDKAAVNEAIFNKRGIIAAVNDYLPAPVSEMSDEDVAQLFETDIEQKVLDMSGNLVDSLMAEDVDLAQERKKPESERLLPLYVYTAEGQKYYIMSVRGNGLWDAIWGAVAVKSDFSTVVGASFDHAQETPGLGAEIKDNPTFSERFKNKQIVNDGDYTSVQVVKGSVKNPSFQVDGISGATVTCNGVSEMLDRGIGYYLPYFNKIRS
ncbi:MAG: NADH:ubiquinone reductase (Na(+)-transporting) subunit C [Bacteroidia bacterium]|nr:NADH:ubiquinone reductase (Na(+)-transporting) subunit C [Bacteroidia bacterium]